MKFKRIILVNQVAGQLFYQLSLGLSKKYEEGGLLISGEICKRNLINEKKSKLICKYSSPYNRKNNLTRLISWIKFSFNITKYVFSFRENDLILITSNPPIIHFWLFIFIKIKKLNFVILIYDIYPNILTSSNYFKVDNPLILIWKGLNRIIYNHANKVITLGESMSRIISNEFKLNLKDIGIVPPWADINIVKPINKENNKYCDAFIGDKKFVVLYSGNMGITHDVESILKAAIILKNYNDILFLFIGGGNKYSHVEEFIVKNNLTNVRLFDYQPDDIFPYTLALADVSIVSVNSNIDDFIFPSKTVYYLAAGSAIIGIGNKANQLKKLIMHFKIGHYVTSKSPHKLASKIKELFHNKQKLNKLKNNSRNLAINKFSIEEGIKKFFNYIKDL